MSSCGTDSPHYLVAGDHADNVESLPDEITDPVHSASLRSPLSLYSFLVGDLHNSLDNSPLQVLFQSIRAALMKIRQIASPDICTEELIRRYSPRPTLYST